MPYGMACASTMLYDMAWHAHVHPLCYMAWQCMQYAICHGMQRELVEALEMAVVMRTDEGARRDI